MLGLDMPALARIMNRWNVIIIHATIGFHHNGLITKWNMENYSLAAALVPLYYGEYGMPHE